MNTFEAWRMGKSLINYLISWNFMETTQFICNSYTANGCRCEDILRNFRHVKPKSIHIERSTHWDFYPRECCFSKTKCLQLFGFYTKMFNKPLMDTYSNKLGLRFRVLMRRKSFQLGVSWNVSNICKQNFV